LKKEASLDTSKKDGDKKGNRNTENSKQLTRDGKDTIEDEPNSADGDREKDGDSGKEGVGEEKKDDENGDTDGADGERDEKGDEFDNAGADRDKKEDDKVVDTSTGPAFVIR
jgi:hypothetical protein